VARHPNHKAGTGRPRLNINLEDVEKLGEMQCTLPEIADFLRVSQSTVEKRRAQDPEFAEALDRGYALGRISVRRKQMQMLEANNSTMAVWLGKQLLGQRERVETTGENGGPIESRMEVVFVRSRDTNASD